MIKINISNKYNKYYSGIEKEENLIDNCKYIVYFNDKYKYLNDYLSIPVRTKKEAIKIIKNNYNFYNK